MDEPSMDMGKLFDWMTESYEKYMHFDDNAVREIDESLLSQIEFVQQQQLRQNQEIQKVSSFFYHFEFGF